MLTKCADISVSPYEQEPNASDLAVIFHDNKVLLRNGANAPEIPTWSELGEVIPIFRDAIPFELACSGDIAAFAPPPSQGLEIKAPDGFEYMDVRTAFAMPEPYASLLPSCLHLWRWYGNNRFCGRCGAPLSPSKTERALYCETCGNTIYPMIAPAVIVAITRQDKLLLARNRNYVSGVHTLIAGYVEVGEALEQTVRREAMEEVGLELGSISYLGNQPWGVSGSLMFAFSAEAPGSEPIRIQESELSEASWYSRDELPPTPRRGSVAHALIERFKKGLL